VALRTNLKIDPKIIFRIENEIFIIFSGLTGDRGRSVLKRRHTYKHVHIHTQAHTHTCSYTHAHTRKYKRAHKYSHKRVQNHAFGVYAQVRLQQGVEQRPMQASQRPLEGTEQQRQHHKPTGQQQQHQHQHVKQQGSSTHPISFEPHVVKVGGDFTSI